jgi:hypothetical protein
MLPSDVTWLQHATLLAVIMIVLAPIDSGKRHDHMLAGDTMLQELAAVYAKQQAVSNTLQQRDLDDGMEHFELNIELRDEAGGLWLHELEMALLNGHAPIVPEKLPGDACTPCEQGSRCVEDVLQKPDVDRTIHKKEGRMLVGLELGWKWPLLPLEIYDMTPGWVTLCLERPEDSHQILRVCFDSHVDTACHFKGVITGRLM